MLYRFLHLLQARPGQAGRHFQSPKVHLCGRVSRAAESGCRYSLVWYAATPTPNGRHATRVIGRDCQRDAASVSLVEMWRQHWRHTHGAPRRELDTPTVLYLYRMWNKQRNLVVYCASHLTYVSIQAKSLLGHILSNSATNFPNMLAKSGLIIYRTSKSLLGNLKKKKKKYIWIKSTMAGGFRSESTFYVFFFTFNVKKIICFSTVLKWEIYINKRESPLLLSLLRSCWHIFRMLLPSILIKRSLR